MTKAEKINENTYYKDNTNYKPKKKFIELFPNLSHNILDRTLNNLVEEENILLFPMDLDKRKGLDKSAKLLESVNGTIKFHNIVGFLGDESRSLTIHSRFSKDRGDYFFKYLLKKVMNINIVDLTTDLSFEESFYRLLIYIFPSYLNAALRKGLYKEYRDFEYNDVNVRGTIDLARHIRNNIPFRGNIAYRTREFTFDNELMQLVRHTIEFIRVSQNNSKNILYDSRITRENVAMVVEATSSYHANDRRKVIEYNKKKAINHAYYIEYRMLQKICLMILTGQKHSFGNGNGKIKGILFDISWLWEEYIGTILKEEFIHPQNKAKSGFVYVFKEEELNKNYLNSKMYPDFYHKETSVILDTKYKFVEDGNKGSSGISRSDRYQLLSYMYVLKSEYAGIFYPTMGESKFDEIGRLNGYGGHIFKYGMHIPQETSDFKEFVQEMQKSEEHVQKVLLPKLSEKSY